MKQEPSLPLGSGLLKMKGHGRSATGPKAAESCSFPREEGPLWKGDFKSVHSTPRCAEGRSDAEVEAVPLAGGPAPSLNGSLAAGVSAPTPLGLPGCCPVHAVLSCSSLPEPSPTPQAQAPGTPAGGARRLESPRRGPSRSPGTSCLPGALGSLAVSSSPTPELHNGGGGQSLARRNCG